MQSQKFISNYKCECYGHNFCNCPYKSSENSLFMENIYDVSETLAQIMIICGIHQCKAKAAIDVIIYSFLHYDEIRHRVDAVPRKRLCKEDLIHDLGRKCLMNRMEAQLTYSIIKRAFKAFYHGTSEGGIRNPELEAQLVHSQECLWVHAAKRTAQIFASYEGMFFSAQKNYEALIKCLYKQLYDRMKGRTSPLVVDDCSCRGCVKRTIVQAAKPTKSMFSLHGIKTRTTLRMSDESDSSTRALPVVRDAKDGEDVKRPCRMGESSEQVPSCMGPKLGSSTSLNVPRCYQCNCPRLICECDVDQTTGLVTSDCSQGPFKCQWMRMDKEDEDQMKKICTDLPPEHECPVDCDAESMICDAECECDCESCECKPEDTESEFEDEALEAKIEEEDIGETVVTSETCLPEDACNFAPNPKYDNCRVPVGHVVEEEKHEMSTIAKTEGSALGVRTDRTLTDDSDDEVGDEESEEDDEARHERDEILKLLGSML